MSTPAPNYSYRKLQASDVGLHAPRGCTNVCCLVFFIIMWIGIIVVSVISFRKGDINELIYGVDYMGNICSRPNPKYKSYNFSTSGIQNSLATSWESRKYLWYPVAFDGTGFSLQKSKDNGVCVESCPVAGNSLGVYYDASNPQFASPYYVLFNSSVLFNRCVPKISSFLCASNQACQTLKNSTLTDISMFYSGLENAVGDITRHWWVLLVCTVIAIVLSFIWMFIMRRLVKPLVVATGILLLVAIAVGGIVLYVQSKRVAADVSKYFLGGAIGLWVVDFLILCVILFLIRDIMVACDIIEEASKIPLSLPTTLLVPPVASIAMIPFAIFFLFTTASIYTASTPITFNSTLALPSQSASTYISVKTTQLQFENWRIPAFIFNLFMFLWTVGFINAIYFLIVAFCALFWYWSRPGDNKEPEAGVCVAAKLTFRNHLGTLALGSFIIAVIQVLSIVLRVFEKQMTKYSLKSDAVKCCLSCVQCCLACFHRVVKFINKNAYIVTAMTGEDFMDAARHALSLLVRNALSVAAVSIVGEMVCILGKVLITALVGLICYGIVKSTDGNFVLTLVLVVLVTYFITSVFINIFSICIDTVLLSYCYDLNEHDGQSKPYYFTNDLAKHVNRARERMAAHEKSEAEAEKPLSKTT